MAGYSNGTVIVSQVDAQGMRRGQRYVFQGASVQATFAGTFVTYFVSPEGQPERANWFPIGNAHILTREVQEVL